MKFKVLVLLLLVTASYSSAQNSISEKYYDVSQKLIAENIKAEIARQLWTEEGLYMVLNTQDQEVKAAIEQLKKVKP